MKTPVMEKGFNTKKICNDSCLCKEKKGGCTRIGATLHYECLWKWEETNMGVNSWLNSTDRTTKEIKTAGTNTNTTVLFSCILPIIQYLNSRAIRFWMEHIYRTKSTTKT